MKKKILILLAVLMVALSSMTAWAYDYGILRAKAHYKHPVTGVIEDPGNNEGIGQGMCDNVLYPQALLENVDGELFVTVRYNLYNYMENISFAVQNHGDDAFYKVPHTVVKNTDETADLRFQIPSMDAVVRSTFYVGPMGRDVIYYFDFDNYTPGNTDFILQEEGGAPAAPTAPATPAKDQSDQVTLVDASALGEKVEIQAVNDLMQGSELGFDHGFLTADSEELKSYIAKIRGEVSEEEEAVNPPEEKTYGEPGFYTKALFIWLLAMVGGLILILTHSLIVIKLKGGDRP